MQIQVNGEVQQVSDGLSVSDLITKLDLRADQIAIELNHQVLRRPEWESTPLKNNDRIEIVHFVGGGAKIAANERAKHGSEKQPEPIRFVTSEQSTSARS